MKSKFKRKLSFADAINEAQVQAMKLDKNVFILGQGVEKGAMVFNTNKNIEKKFGSKRIFDTPNSEQAETSFAAGAANAGLRPILIHQRVDFMVFSFEQIVNWISLWSFKSSGKCKMPLVIRAIIGRGWGQGPQHSKTLHTFFSYLPGIKVVMPSSPSEAKGQLLSSIMSNDPVIFLEYRALYNSSEHVPKEPYFLDLSSPRHRLKGKDLTVVSMGASTLTVLKAAKELSKINIKVDLFDLRELSNFKMKNIFSSVKKTKKILVVEDGWKNFGIGSEIISKISESGIKLAKPARRINWPNSHVPMSSVLENKFYFDHNKVIKSCLELCKKK